MLKFNCYFPRIFWKLNKINYGKNPRIIGWPFVFRYPTAAITIGDDFSLNSNFFSNLLGLYQRSIIIARGNGEIVIGKHVGISGSTLYARKKIEIGDYTLIGANCKIIDNDFHSLDVEERNCDNMSNLQLKPVYIGKSVFIGCNSIILKGTTIGNNCVVGAGSVVSGKFPDNCVIGGNPAKIIRTLKKS